MIDKIKLKEFVERQLEETSYFLVDVKVSVSNIVEIEIDSFEPVDVDFCAELSGKIEQEFPRDEEDYELMVGSSGLTSPFKVKKQYEKYIGQEVETITGEGKLLRGLLKSAGEDAFTIVERVKEKPEGAKRPVLVDRETTLRYDEVKQTKYDLKF